MKDQKRHSDKADTMQLSSFMEEYLVKCPKCSALAIIREHRLTCTGCHTNIHEPEAPQRAVALLGGHYSSAGVKHWHGRVNPVLEREDGTPERFGCTGCGNDLPAPDTRQNSAHLPRTLEIACDGCGRENTFTPIWKPAYAANEVRDPAFGCELYLQKSLRDGTLFAFNAEHAEVLRGYVDAGLREWKTEDKGMRSYFTNLPAWIKAAKNRDTIVKTLEMFMTSVKFN
ncbi:hypothetical protein [Kordiimonas sp.]|uniref:hypothetical protein n=1 Tax=Kordiimonas sp. TaxID=1970157 RepID=UPI003A92A0C4